MSLRDRLGEPLPISLLDFYVEASDRDGLSAFDWFEKKLSLEAMVRVGLKQKDAARALGVSPRMLNYVLGKWGARPMDRRKDGPVQS